MTIKGPAIFLAQFAGDEPPFNSLDAITSVETSAMLRAALEKLPQDQREAIKLAFFESLTQSEIAERLNEPVGTIKARIRRGLTKMRESLQRKI